MNVWELLLKLMFAVPPLGVALIAAALKLVAKLDDRTVSWGRALLIGTAVVALMMAYRFLR